MSFHFSDLRIRGEFFRRLCEKTGCLKTADVPDDDNILLQDLEHYQL